MTPYGEALIEAGARAIDPPAWAPDQIWLMPRDNQQRYARSRSRASLLAFLSHIEARYPKVVAELRKEIE